MRDARTALHPDGALDALSLRAEYQLEVPIRPSVVDDAHLTSARLIFVKLMYP
jgi:hypothetical protein